VLVAGVGGRLAMLVLRVPDRLARAPLTASAARAARAAWLAIALVGLIALVGDITELYAATPT
jgi:hypothetical protein